MSKALRYIGIAKKAGKLVFGTQMVCDALRSNSLKNGDCENSAVFVASDVSEATLKKLTDKCSFYSAELVRLADTSSELAHGIGKTGAVAAVYISDEGLSKAAVSAAKEA